MKRTYLLKLRMYLTVLAYLKLNISIWTANAVFAAAVNKLDLGVKKIRADDLVDKKTNNETLVKHDLCDKMIIATKVVCDAGTAYGTSIDNPTLSANFDYSIDDLNAGTDVAIYNRCINIGAAATAFSTEFQTCGMPVGQLALVISTAKSFIDNVNINRDKRTAGKTANKDMTKEYKSVDLVLKKLLDKLVNNYKVAEPAFWAGYQDVRYIGGWANPPEEQEPPVDPITPVE